MFEAAGKLSSKTRYSIAVGCVMATVVVCGYHALLVESYRVSSLLAIVLMAWDTRSSQLRLETRQSQNLRVILLLPVWLSERLLLVTSLEKWWKPFEQYRRKISSFLYRHMT